MLTVRTSENTVITSFRLISERQDFSSVRTAENTVRARARIHYIAELSLFADLFYYVLGILAAWGLRKKHPELKRSYKAPLIMVGAPASALIYLYMMTELSNEAFYTGVIWCLLGIAIYWCCSKYYGAGASFKLDEKASGVDEIPTPEEKRSMDREYHLWWFLVGGLSIVATLLYLLPYLMR